MDKIKKFFNLETCENLDFFSNKKYIFYNELENKIGNRYNEAKNNITIYDTYSCSPDTIENILNSLNINNTDSILDIGSGRGFFMILCYMFPFKKIGGIEISKRDSDISLNNFNLLNINMDRINIINDDVLNFNNYDEYNYFYFYNPFGAEIFEKILLKISKIKNANILYLNIHNEEKNIIEKYNFKLHKTFIDNTINRNCNWYKL